MDDDSFSPRTLIQAMVQTNPDQLDQTVRVTRRQAHALNTSKEQASAKRPSRKRSSSESASTTKKTRPNRSRLSTSVAEATPRTLITGFLSQQDSEKTVRIERRVTRASPKSSTQRRRSRRASLLKEATTRRMRQSVSGFAEEPTPRTMIRGILQDGDDETPVVAIRQRRKSSLYHAVDSSEIEVSPIKSPAKSQRSVSEDSFMEAYHQLGPSQPLTRQRKDHFVRSALSSADFAASIQEKLSQSNQSRWVSSSQLGDISEIDEAEGRSARSFGKVIGTVTIAADVHHTPDKESIGDRETSDEDEVPQLDISEDRSATSPELTPVYDTDRRHVSERHEVDEGAPDTEDSEREAVSERENFHQTADQEDEGSVVSRTELSHNETAGVERQAAVSGRGAVVAAVGELKEASVEKDEEQQEEEQEQEEQEQYESEQAEQEESEHAEQGEQEESEQAEQEEQENQISNQSLVPASENEDESDSPEGLPGFNRTFTASTAGSFRQTTLDGYSAIQTPMLPPTKTQSQLRTPDIPVTALQQSRAGATQQTPRRDKAPSRGRNPSVQATSKAKPEKAKKKKVPPRLPSRNTSSIFKHFTSERVSKEALMEIEKVADEFWKNVATDLECYASHAGRVTVDESDVNLLMNRQHITTEHQSMYTLVEKYLPLEYQLEIIDVVKSGNEIVP